jgi:hypothetical protein
MTEPPARTDRLTCRCRACGYVWHAAHLPMDASKIARFSKVACPRCHDLKPYLAGEGDRAMEDRLAHYLSILVVEAEERGAVSPAVAAATALLGEAGNG